MSQKGETRLKLRYNVKDKDFPRNKSSHNSWKILRNRMKEALLKHLQEAYALGPLRLIKRIHALLFIIDGKTVAEVAQILDLSKQSVYTCLKAFLLKKLDSLKYTRPPGRPPKLTKTQRKELRKLIDNGPEAAGYDCGCWITGLIQDLILTRFKVAYTLITSRGLSSTPRTPDASTQPRTRLSYRTFWTKPATNI